MSKVILIMLACSFIFFIFAQNEIFKANLCGMEVQQYNPADEIDSLTVYQSGEWVYLRAWCGSNFGDIVGTKNKETALQDAIPPVGYFTGFVASGPDAQNYIYLTAVSDGGFSEDIIRTKLFGSGTQTFNASAGYCISGFIASGPDVEGYVYLAVQTELIGIEEDEKNLEESQCETLKFELKAIIPNPCVDHARLFYSIAHSCPVKLRIYDSSGRLIKTLIDTKQTAGRYNLSWGGVDESGRAASSGVYFVRFEAGNFCATKKLLLTK